MPNDNVIRTGIAGLDSLLMGGIPRTNVILVEGTTGSGKTLTAFLCDQIDRAEQTHSLVTEDGSPVVEHTDTARSLVLRAAADVDDAYRLANSARSELSPLKISG